MIPSLAVLIGGVLLVTGIASSGVDGPAVLSLHDAVEQALQQNPNVRAAQDAVSIAAGSLKLANSMFEPQLTPTALGSFGQSTLANQNYGISFAQLLHSGTRIDADIAAVTARNQFGAFVSVDNSIRITQPLLRGFGRNVVTADETLAQLRVSEARTEQAQTERQLAVEVAAAYYRIVSQLLMIDVADHAQQRARDLLDAARAKLTIGKVSRLDVVRAEQFAAQAELQAMDARAAVDDAKDQLRLLLMKPAAFDFDVSRDLPDEAETLTLEAASKIALDHREDVRAAETAVQEAELSLKVANDRALPQLDVTGLITRQNASDTLATAFRAPVQAAAYVGVSMPFNRTSPEVGRANAAIELSQRERRREEVKLTVEQQVRVAYRNQARLLKVREQVETSVRLAEEEVELTSLRYQRGLSNNFDVVTAEGDLLAARARRYSVLADSAVARLQFRSAVGILDPRKDVR